MTTAMDTAMDTTTTEENKSAMDTSETDNTEMNDVGGLDEDDTPEMAYLIGFDEDEKNTKEFEVDFEALKRYSGFVRSAFEGDKDCKQFKVKSGRQDINVNKLASCDTVKFMADWINHYSGKGSIKPRIIEFPMKPRDLPSLIKYTFKDSSLPEEIKKSEGKWWEEFIISMEESFNAIYDVFYAANRMEMTSVPKTPPSEGFLYGGLVNMIASSLAHHIKGEPIKDIEANLAKLGDELKYPIVKQADAKKG